MEIKHFKKLTLATALTAAIGLGMSTAIADGSYVSVDSSSVSATASVAGATSIEIRVAGPNGYRETVSGYGGSVSWNAPYGMSDGDYRYEVFVTVDTGDGDELNADNQLYRETGRFTVQGGVISIPAAGDGSASLDADNESSWLAQVGGAVLDFVFPPAHAADLTIADTSPVLIYDDTSLGDTYDWGWYAEGGLGSAGFMKLVDSNEGGSTYPIYITSGENNDDSFVVDGNGDIGLAQSSVFIDKSTNSVGIGTVTPAEELHITSSYPQIRLDNTGGQIWEMIGGSAAWAVEDVTNGGYPFFISTDAPQYSIKIDGTSGDVGMGTFNPVAPLHVYRADGTSNLTVQETNATTTTRSMFDLINNGEIGFNMTNTATGKQWRFKAATTDFRVSLDGSGGPEMIVGETGTLSVGPGSSTNMFLDASGNLTISGYLSQGSDRNIKTNIKDLDHGQVLEKVAALPLSQWAYKKEPTVNHVGPMAQDFYAAFGYGADDKHIAPGDLASVALAGVKELHTMIKQRDEKIEQLTAQLEQQRAQTNAVAARLNNLEVVIQRVAKYGVPSEVVAENAVNQ